MRVSVCVSVSVAPASLTLPRDQINLSVLSSLFFYTPRGQQLIYVGRGKKGLKDYNQVIAFFFFFLSSSTLAADRRPISITA